MPGARSYVEPVPAINLSVEETQLDLHLQQQLEEDIARIFDESICSDLEVVCGKLKILTHSCILKARTHKFYHKLEAILHVNIGRNTFDEIYSFISDAYTECNIQKQENEIINYLDENLNIFKTVVVQAPTNKVEEIEDTEVYSTPKCTSPEENNTHKPISSSPSTELTKEYYALVPIEGNILDKELIEQDVLSNAFKSFINSQTDRHISDKQNQCIKPTSLSLDCNKPNITNKYTCNKKHNQNKDVDIVKYSHLPDTSSDKVFETYSPDSLITDEPSSSSDYLSAAYAVTPGVIPSNGTSQFNVGENLTKMDNLITISDSGLDNTAMLESLNSHKDVTLTDMSLTDSTSHDITNDDPVNCFESPSFYEDKKNKILKLNTNSIQSPTSASSSGKGFKEHLYKPPLADVSGTSSKEEKQRQNEEIVILESSSLSSETGSWESVFPPKCPDKDISEKFINSERQCALEDEIKAKPPEAPNENISTSLVQKSPFKSTSCFIDAASLADEGDQSATGNEYKTKPIPICNSKSPDLYHPVPYSSKSDISPNDWSGSNDNDDSLEQADVKVPDSVILPLSADFTIPPSTKTKSLTLESASAFSSSTPNNSIISLEAKEFVRYASEESDINSTMSVLRPEDKYMHELSQIPLRGNLLIAEYDTPIISGGASVEDHLPQLGSSYSGSPLTRRKIENIPIVSGAYIPDIEEKQDKPSKAPSSASAWVVDMSSSSKSDINNHITPNKMSLHSTSKSTSSVENCKSRSSVDSDSSEKSSKIFYIDLYSLKDASPAEQLQENCDSVEKKNIFSMFIGLDDKSTTVKEMPVRLSSSLNSKKRTETKRVISKVVDTMNITSNNDSMCFERLESLCNDPNLSISEIINVPTDHKEKRNEFNNKHNIKKDEVEMSTKNVSNKLVHEVIKEEKTYDDPSGLFVKLSDLDKATKDIVPRIHPQKEDSNERMTRSIPNNDWRESSQSTNSKCDLLSSFHSENALSLNRLFPNLKNEFSRSLPGYLSSTMRSSARMGLSSSPGDIEEQPFDGSEISSVQSSYCPSVIENSTTEDTSQTTSLINNCQSRLGQDLLRMFLQEIAPDVIVEAAGRRIKAHKCILSSRCQYFAGILSGRWVRNAGNVISLPPFSYSVVHFTLCHIYSGISTIPENVSIVELSTLADMLGLEGMKEAIMFKLKAKYCHNFHKPCPVCMVGVLECLPLTLAYGLDDLNRKCLKWITKHFDEVWPTKTFATMALEIREKCFQDHIVNLSMDNILHTVCGTGKIMASLQNNRWSVVVRRLCERLISAASLHAASRLEATMRKLSAESVDLMPAAELAFYDFMYIAIERAPLEEACRTYAFLSQHIEARSLSVRNSTNSIHDNLLDLHAERWREACEGAVMRASSRVIHAQTLKNLSVPVEQRKWLRELGFNKFPTETSAPKTSRTAVNKNDNRRQSPTSRIIDMVRATFTPYSPRPRPQSQPLQAQPRSQPQQPVLKSDARVTKAARSTAPPRVRTTKAQEERAKFNKIKTVPQAVTKPTQSKPRKCFENLKPRYLMPLREKGECMARSTSSESSTVAHPSREHLCAAVPASRPDTAGPSTESLTDSHTNKYATFTKVKHHTKGSETVQAPKCQPRTVPATKSTKIPMTSVSKCKLAYMMDASRKVKPAPNVATSNPSPVRSPQTRNKVNEQRKSFGSLMNATKSSSAKVVTKIVKDSPKKSPVKHADSNKQSSARSRASTESHASDIPIMERSGTFLKDEATFHDTTSYDIDPECDV